MKLSNCKEWQKNPELIETERVQLWSANGNMITAQMKKEDARESVRAGRAFVITSQAIGLFDEEAA